MSKKHTKGSNKPAGKAASAGQGTVQNRTVQNNIEENNAAQDDLNIQQSAAADGNTAADEMSEKDLAKAAELSAIEEFDRIMADFEDNQSGEQAQDASSADPYGYDEMAAAAGFTPAAQTMASAGAEQNAVPAYDDGQNEGLGESAALAAAGIAASDIEATGTGAAGLEAAEIGAASVKASPKKELTLKQRRKLRRKKKRMVKRNRKSHAGAVILILLLVFLCAAAVAAYVGYQWVYSCIKDLPEINPSNFYDLLSENSQILNSDGELMENVYSGSSLRTNVTYNEVPKDLVNAFVAIEDKTFFDHHGFNFIRMVGAIVQTLTGQSERVGGTSTITQQLARNLYLSDIKSVRSLERKVQEAYYTLVIERTLTKEQILEAYMNTVYLGYNSTGVQAACQAYFSKEAKDLTLIECAILAALPQSPGNYSPVKRIATSDITADMNYDIISQTDEYAICYNDVAESRVRMVLFYMHEQGKLSDEEYMESKSEVIRSYINPGTDVTSASTTSYFTDYVVSEVKRDLMKEYDLTEEEAAKYLYQGGLRIYSTIDPAIQNIMEEEYAIPSNFPANKNFGTDKNGNILDEKRQIKLYAKKNILDEEGNFVLQPGEWERMEDGSLKLFSGKKMNFYRTTSAAGVEYTSEFKKMYENEVDASSGVKLLYSQDGHLSIPGKYKDRDENGDLIISHSYFDDMKIAGHEIILEETEGGKLVFSKDLVVLNQKILQPQSAMVIIDYSTGQIKGMVGGRGVEGKLLYNRATAARQPGSSIKPLAVYSLALQIGFEENGRFTAATPLDDAPISLGGSPWPKDWYSGYRGITNLRNAVEQSINACAVNLYMQLDPLKSIENLQKMGVTSLVTTGSVNDVNASALALGGMTYGISPLEMASAYSTFGNYGEHIETTSYTKILNSRGDVILISPQEKTRVLDEEVASLMVDILRTTVTNGLANEAKIKSQPTAGKTGTTSDRYDIWFCGLTPKYSAAVWIGNDDNFELNSGSSGATKLWAKVMERVGALDEKGEFVMKGDFVTVTVDKNSGKLPTNLTTAKITEKFIAGTQPTSRDDSHKVVSVCAETGYLATPYCKHIVKKNCVQRPSGQSWEESLVSGGLKGLSISSEPDAKNDIPGFYCPVHNPSKSKYPVSPLWKSGVSIYGNGTAVIDDKPTPAGKDEHGNYYYKDAKGNIYYLDKYNNRLSYDEMYPDPEPEPQEQKPETKPDDSSGKKDDKKPDDSSGKKDDTKPDDSSGKKDDTKPDDSGSGTDAKPSGN